MSCFNLNKLIHSQSALPIGKKFNSINVTVIQTATLFFELIFVMITRLRNPNDLTAQYPSQVELRGYAQLNPSSVLNEDEQQSVLPMMRNQLSFNPVLVKSQSVRTNQGREAEYGRILKDFLDPRKTKGEQLITELSPRRRLTCKEELSDLKRNLQKLS